MRAVTSLPPTCNPETSPPAEVARVHGLPWPPGDSWAGLAQPVAQLGAAEPGIFRRQLLARGLLNPRAMSSVRPKSLLRDVLIGFGLGLALMVGLSYGTSAFADASPAVSAPQR